MHKHKCPKCKAVYDCAGFNCKKYAVRVCLPCTEKGLGHVKADR